MVSDMLEGHLQKISNITLERTPSQATELLGTELVSTEKVADQEDTEKEPATNQMEDDHGKRYQEIPGIGLITPATGGDLRCKHSKAISLMTENPLQDSEEGPITDKQRKKNKNRCRFGMYMAYNTSHDKIILPKNKLVGQCQLILQPNKAAYQQELSAM